MTEHPFVSLQKIYEFAASTDTDKGTTHSYLDVYAALFGARRLVTRRVLEVGVQTGGSIALWERFFPGAEIVGVDVTLAKLTHTPGERTKILVKDAYEVDTLAELGGGFDIVIDDGPHTLESMIFAAANFPALLAEGGMLVIEDVQKPEWIPQIVAALPEHLRGLAETVDRRAVKRRYDDIMLVVRT